MIARVLRLPEWLDEALRKHADEVRSNWHDLFVFALVRYIEVVSLVKDLNANEGLIEVLTFENSTQWVVDCKEMSRNTFMIRLLEVMQLKSGNLISTGRRTPGFAFSVLQNSYEKSAERIRRSLSIMDAEELFLRDQESLMVAAQFTEELSDVIRGATNGEESGD